MARRLSRQRGKFHAVMAGCAGFVLLMLAALVYVCSRPQTESVQAREQEAIFKCRERSEDALRSDIFRTSLASACEEMGRQYVHKFGEKP